jgi:hypothetical protein
MSILSGVTMGCLCLPIFRVPYYLKLEGAREAQEYILFILLDKHRMKVLF